MGFVVEAGFGTPLANAYCAPAFVTDYLTDRARVTENTWSTAGDAAQKAAIIKATDYIETRWGPMFMGCKALTDIPGRQASALLTLSVLPITGSTITLGQKVYRMVDTLAQENDILIGASVALTFTAIAAAIEGSELNTTTEAHTLPNYEATSLDQVTSLAVLARQVGENGNAIAFSTDIVGATITTDVVGFLCDGLDDGPQPLSFPRRGLYMRDGRVVVGVPLKVRQATAEYAVRARAAILAKDPTVDASLLQVIGSTKTVGPISKSVQYAQGSSSSYVIQAYPAADRLLAEFVLAGGGAYR